MNVVVVHCPKIVSVDKIFILFLLFRIELLKISNDTLRIFQLGRRKTTETTNGYELQWGDQFKG